MYESPRFSAPPVSDEDVAWVCRVLRLPPEAFSGLDGHDPRLAILKSNETMDIEACPGSGKTTLLVAKLAVLARKWVETNRGVCVLSHTNAARREIEQRLSHTAEGKRLLSYPHFVGTIHSFASEFLAIPWLRSLGYPVTVIDDDQCEQHRRRLLRLMQFRALATYASHREEGGRQNVVSNWRIASPQFGVLKANGEPEFEDPTCPSARQLSSLVERSVRDGYYCYDDMFVWANDLLNQNSEVRDAIRDRFPLLFVDEVQDSSELQSALLFRVFIEGKDPVVRQRFGDPNQAIYRHAGETEGAKTDRFPQDGIRRDIPNSHRFGQEIACLAGPLALDPQHLVGCGPPREVVTSDTSGKNAIFLFTDKTLKNVLQVYAGYLLQVFSEPDLGAGVFTAVGGVHRPSGVNNTPRSVGQYWSEYDYELADVDPKPETFLQYVMAGRRLAELSGEAHHLIEKVAEGLLWLVHVSNPTASLSNRRRRHRYLLELLTGDLEARDAYLDLVAYLSSEQRVPSMEEWKGTWARTVRRIAEAIARTPLDPGIAERFLEWDSGSQQDHKDGPPPRRDNLFRYPAANPKVQIRVGSIHSVKGQTHTATLVMETYYHEHQLKALKPWLLGQKRGKGKEKGVRILSRLKQHYVAMTRPSHLLCLAMREDTFTTEELARLQHVPWRVGRVTDGGPVWL